MLSCTRYTVDFHDPDEITEFLSGKKYIHDKLSVVPGTNSIQYETMTASSAAFVVSRTSINGQVSFVPETEWDWQFFVFTDHGKIDWLDGGHLLRGTPQTSIATLGSRCAKLQYSQEHRQLSIAIRPDILAHRLSLILGAPIDKEVAFQETVESTLPRIRNLSSIAHNFVNETNVNLFSDGDFISRRMKEILIDLILVNWPHNYSAALKRGHQPATRNTVQRAIDFIEADPMAVPTLSALAKVCGVSVRAIQYGFERQLDITPIEYIRNVRVKRAADDILSDPLAPISDIALRWGFTNPGRFSGYFKKLYKMRPLEYRKNI